MRINMRSKYVEMSPSLREHIARRLGFGLRRFRTGIDYVRLNLTGHHGFSNGRGYVCVIVAYMVRHGMVVGTGAGSTPEMAVNQAVDRVVRRLTIRRKAKRAPVEL